MLFDVAELRISNVGSSMVGHRAVSL
jgi:hypothetical protein